MQYYLLNFYPFLVMGVSSFFFLVILYLSFPAYARYEDAKLIYVTAWGLFLLVHVGRIGCLMAGESMGPILNMVLLFLFLPWGDVLVSAGTTGLAFLLFKRKPLPSSTIPTERSLRPSQLPSRKDNYHSVQYAWLEPWEELSASAQAACLRQLDQELTPSHPLYSSRSELTPVGKNSSTDDVLFRLGETQWVVVHLTWTGGGDNAYPRTEFFADWASFSSQRMKPDALEYY